MLFKQAHLDGIRDGSVSLAFRRWKRCAVKPGSLVKTAIGRVEIVDVRVVASVPEDEARLAGFTAPAELDRLLERGEGQLYRIALRYHSPDPRVSLREDANLSDAAFSGLAKRCERLDRASRAGPWTVATLQAIERNPHLRAADVAELAGWERDPFKLNVRKLKNLGLTISHEVGYALSPRGEAFLARVEGRG